MSNYWHGQVIPPAINTSPLIFLTKGRVLDLLQIIAQEIVVPNEETAAKIVMEADNFEQ